MTSNTQEIKEQPPGFFDWVDRSLVTVMIGSTLLVAVALVVQISYGAFSMSFGQAWGALVSDNVWGNPRVVLTFLLGEGFAGDVINFLGLSAGPVELTNAETIVWNIRLPRVIVGVFVGMNLAVSGAIFQAITRNELASPFILGVSSGAGLAVLLTLVFFSGLAGFIPLFAAVGGMIAFLLVYIIAWKGGTSPVRLVLAGVIVGTMFSSLQRGLFFFIDDIGTVQSALAWTTGSLLGTDWEQVRLILPWSIISVGLALLASRQLNILLLGEETAESLGVPVEKVRFALSGVGVLAAAASISVAGIVGFVGLIVPHMLRPLIGNNYKRLIVGCVFLGPALVVFADMFGRLALSPTQIPVGVVTGVIGGPYFLYLMRRQYDLGEI